MIGNRVVFEKIFQYRPLQVVERERESVPIAEVSAIHKTKKLLYNKHDIALGTILTLVCSNDSRQEAVSRLFVGRFGRMKGLLIKIGKTTFDIL